MKRIDITGNKYGRLTVLEFAESKKKAAFFKCKCECGNITVVASASLRYGLTSSCGCIAKEVSGNRARTHGEAKKTKEYRTWEGLKSRCYTESDKRYYCYGAIGIKVCDRWKDSYENFLADMGRAPGPEYSIDRKNVKGDYEPENCRWATDLEQANNKSTTVWIEYEGRKLSLHNWSKELSVNYKSLHKLIKYKKMSFENAIKKLKPI